MSKKWFCCPFPGCHGVFPYKHGSTQHLNRNEVHRQYITDRADVYSMEMLLVDHEDQAPLLLINLNLLIAPQPMEAIVTGNTFPIEDACSSNLEADDASLDLNSNLDILESPLDKSSSDSSPLDRSYLDMSIEIEETESTTSKNKVPINSVPCQRDYVLDWLDEIYSAQQQEPNDTTSTLPFDTSLLEMYKNDRNNDIHFSIPTNLQAEIILMNNLNQRSGIIPKYVFNNLVGFMKEWVVPHSELSRYNEYRPRERVMKDILKLTCLDEQLPQENFVDLPNLGVPCKVTSFDFYAVLYDMLTDPLLNKESSYIFKDESPLTPPDPSPLVYNDIDTGWRYIKSWAKLQTSPTVLPLPLITFIDKANLAQNDRLSMEAVMIQLGIHNRATRNKFESFRNLGMLPRLEKLPYKETLSKIKDYHFVLDHIFEGLRKIMSSKRPLLWVMCHKGHYYRVILVPYILVNVGDTVGHNVICAKAAGNFTKYKCRYCMCPSEHLGDPMVNYRRLLREDYVFEHNTAAHMKTMSMHLIDNAFDKLEQGFNPHGTLGLCLGEIVHAIQGGSHERFIEALLNFSLVKKTTLQKEKIAYNKRLSKGWYMVTPPTHKLKLGRRPIVDESTENIDVPNLIYPVEMENIGVVQSDNSDSSDDSSNDSSQDTPKDLDNGEVETDSEEDDDDSVSSSESDVSIEPADKKKKRKRTGVLVGVHSKRIDNLSRRIGRQIQHQSYRDNPPVYFAAGISTQAKTSSSEKAGILLLYLVILCSNYGRNSLCQRFGPIRMAYTIQCIENQLCLEEFMKDKDGFFTSFIKPLREYLPEMRQMYRFVVNRSEGEGMNIIKLHLSTHIPDDCEALGSPANISGSAGEMNQKSQKAGGRRTQGNVEDFDQQLSINTVQSNAIRKAFNLVTDSQDRENGQNSSLSPQLPEVTCDGDCAYLASCQYVLRFSRWNKPRIIFTGKSKSSRGKLLKRKPVQCISELSVTGEKIVRYATAVFREKGKNIFNTANDTIDIPMYTRAIVPARKIDGDIQDRYFCMLIHST
jgi:hypothetical protein